MLQLFPNHLFFCPLFPADAQQLLVDNSSVIWAEPLNQKGNNLLWINPDGNNFQRVQQASSFPLTRVDQTNFIPGSNLSSAQCRHKPIVNILSNFATMRHPTYDNEKIGMCCVLTDAGNLVPTPKHNHRVHCLGQRCVDHMQGFAIVNITGLTFVMVGRQENA